MDEGGGGTCVCVSERGGGRKGKDMGLVNRGHPLGCGGGEQRRERKLEWRSFMLNSEYFSIFGTEYAC